MQKVVRTTILRATKTVRVIRGKILIESLFLDFAREPRLKVVAGARLLDVGELSAGARKLVRFDDFTQDSHVHVDTFMLQWWFRVDGVEFFNAGAYTIKPIVWIRFYKSFQEVFPKKVIDSHAVALKEAQADLTIGTRILGELRGNLEVREVMHYYEISLDGFLSLEDYRGLKTDHAVNDAIKRHKLTPQ
jgi:hypothetical protein